MKACERCLSAECQRLYPFHQCDASDASRAREDCAIRTAARAESAEKQLAEMQDVADRYFAQVQRENSALVHYRDKLHEANRLLNVYRAASIRDEELHRVLFAALGKATDWDARSTVDGAKSAGVEAVKSLVAKIAAVRACAVAWQTVKPNPAFGVSTMAIHSANAINKCGDAMVAILDGGKDAL